MKKAAICARVSMADQHLETQLYYLRKLLRTEASRSAVSTVTGESLVARHAIQRWTR